MTDFFTVLIFIGLAIVLIGRSQRRRRSRQLNRSQMEASNHIYRSAPPSALDRQGDAIPSTTEPASVRSTTAQVADVLSQVLGATSLSRDPISETAPDPTWEPPSWSPPEGANAPNTAERAVVASPDAVAAARPIEPLTPDTTADPVLAEPVFAELDPDSTPKAVKDALRNPDLRSAERALRNASLNGVEGADIALGLLMFRAGRKDEAEGVFRNAARTHGVAANNLGVVLENDGRHREAVVFYQKAAALGSKAARDNLKRMEA